MLAFPEELKKMQKEIPQFQVEGTILSSTLKDGSNCMHHYESVIKTSSEEISFTYTVSMPRCFVDSLYDYLSDDPFQENAYIQVNLTNEIPHRLISYKKKYIPSFLIPYIYLGIFLLTVCIILVVKKNRRKTQS